MPIDAKTFAEWEPIASGRVRPEGIGDEAITAIIEAVNEYRDQHLAGTMPKPGEELQMDPSFSLMPQALSVQPATTAPAGDDAEKSAWRVDPQGSAAGKVIVYDVPLAQVKKDLLEHPEKVRALYPDLMEQNPGAVTPESIMALTHNDSLYQDYQARMWRDTANDFASHGKTAIRYSAAPWVAMEGGPLNNLALKLEGAVQPYGDRATAFVMGVDDSALFGAGRAAAEVAGEAGAAMEPLNPFGTERVGGITTTDPAERAEQLEEQYPGSYLGGEALGMLSGWGPANYLFGKALGLGRAVAGSAQTFGGTLSRLAAGTAAGALGGAGMQAGRDAVDAAADDAKQAINPAAERTGPEWESIPDRAQDTLSLGIPLAAAGAAVGEGASRAADRVRWGNRYDGMPGQLEQALGKDIQFKVGKGPVSKPIEELKVEARKANRQPGDVIAQEIGPPIAQALDQDVKGVFEQVATKRKAYLASPEGKQPIRVKNFLTAVTDELRADMKANPMTERGVPTPIGQEGSAKDLHRFFNQQIETVSTAPVPGAIELTPEEAQAFLTPENMRKAWKSRGRPKQAPAPAPDGAPALSPPEELPQSAAQRQPPTPATPVDQPERLDTVPARPAPPGPGRRYGAANALPGRAPPPPEPEPKAPVRVTGEGRKARDKAPRVKSFAADLRARGVDTVYVTPRALDAEGTETLLDKIGTEGQKAGSRDLSKLDRAARLDRDERLLEGKPRGWSELQNQHSELIEKKKLAEQLGSPNGDSFKVLVGYGKPKAGEALKADVLEQAAEKAGIGVRDQLKRLRSLERYEDLRRQASMEGSTRYPHRKTAQSILDAASIRAFPMFQALDPLGGVGPLAGAGAGRAAGLGTTEEDEERRKKRQQEQKQ